MPAVVIELRPDDFANALEMVRQRAALRFRPGVPFADGPKLDSQVIPNQMPVFVFLGMIEREAVPDNVRHGKTLSQSI